MKKLVSLIALAGIFAACQPEEIETAFEVSDAVATIKISAVDVRTNASVAPASLTVTTTAGSYANGVITIEGTPTIPAQAVKVTVTYKADYMTVAEEYSSFVNLLGIRAGGKAEYSVSFAVGSPNPVVDYQFLMEQGVATDETSVTYFTPADGHKLISHEDKFWMRNNSENYLTGTVTWKKQSGSVSSYELNEGIEAEFESAVKNYSESYNTGIKSVDAEPFSITVSAYSYYTVWSTRVITTTPYTVYRYKAADASDKEAIGSFRVKSVVSNQIEYYEIADPDASGKYEGHGHGHGHGGDNAGGGIVYAD